MRKTVISFIFVLMSINLWGYDFKIDKIYYNFNSDSISVSVASWSGSGEYTGKIVIPPKIIYNEKEYIVTEIDSNAFWDCMYVTSIIIPETVTKIGAGAFTWCYGMDSITLPETITEIEDSLFYGCHALKSFTIPKTVTRIGEEAFECCCNLTSIEIPKNVTELGDRVFSRCSNLREIYISSNITKIGISPFVDCSRLENIVVSEINPYYSSEDGILYNKSQSKLIQYPCGKSWKEYNVSNKVKIIGESAFMHCDSLRNITIPDNVEVIEDNAFKYSLNLTDVSIANSVKSLGARAFEKCKSLKRVKLSENIDSIKEYTFSECDSLIRITIPKQTKFIGNRAFFYCKQLSELYLSDSLRVIDEYAFNNCENLTTIELPQSVSKIGQSAFQYCRKLELIDCKNITPANLGINAFDYTSKNLKIFVPSESVNNYLEDASWNQYNILSFSIYENGIYYILDSLTHSATVVKGIIPYSGDIDIPRMINHDGEEYIVNQIDTKAFAHTNLSSVVIPNSIKSLYAYTFYECKNLVRVELPDNLSLIGDYVFYGCEKLNSIKLPNSLKKIGDSAFDNCFNLTSITIPEGITSIGKYTFSGCRQLSSITFPNNLKTIEEGAFEYCQNLKRLNFPNSLTEIKTKAFQYCSGLTELNFPEGILEIGELAFLGCSNIEKLEIPAELEFIGEKAFAECSKLSTVIIPEGITTIANGLFENCSSLSSIEFPESLTKIEMKAFNLCPNLTSLTIPKNVTEIGDFAFYNVGDNVPIKILSDLPPLLGKNAFSDRNILPIIYVNYTSLYNYKNHDDWKRFNVLPIPISVDRLYYLLDANSFTASLAPSGEKYTGDIVIPSKITYEGNEYVVNKISEYAFQYCYDLNSVEIPSTIDSIGEKAFANCFGLKSIVIPNGVKNIGTAAFYYCENLESITIPESVNTIEKSAFSSCKNVKSITCIGEIPATLSQNAFEMVNKDIPLYVPKDAINQYKNSFLWNAFRNIIGCYSVDTSGENGVVKGGGFLPADSTIIISAIPNEGFVFSSWSDDNTDNPREIKLTQDINLKAIFESSLTTEVELPQVTPMKIYMNGNQLVVDGIDDYTIYTLNGQNLGKCKHLVTGVYIIVANNKSFRFIIK